MRFMIIRKADKDTEAGVLPSQEQLAAMLQYNRDMSAAGVFLDGVGLRASSRGARVTFTNGKPTVTDGPFTETKELIAGFTMIQARSLDEALSWVKRWPVEDGSPELEVRQIFEPDDFGDNFTQELREQEAHLRRSSSGDR